MTEFKSEQLIGINNRTLSYVSELIDPRRSETLLETNISTELLPNFEKKYVGKVRDMYVCKDHVVLVTTDRQSAFDRQLAAIPFKGIVLNQTSSWWFEKTKNLVPNHVLGNPHPNMTIGKRCTIFPVEFVVRGYMTGTTSTSMWTNYQKGVREYCGHLLPDGMKKNQRLDEIKVTPTTKSDVHDELISAEKIVSTGLMSETDWKICENYAKLLFSFGQETALSRGLILVDTKYEFGKDSSGNIVLVDEIHTPDSSRYWIADSYDARFDAGEEPENIDKEFLRKWFAANCDPYDNTVPLPDAPAELVNELSRRYIMIYEILTGKQFADELKVADDLNACIAKFF